LTTRRDGFQAVEQHPKLLLAGLVSLVEINFMPGNIVEQVSHVGQAFLEDNLQFITAQRSNESGQVMKLNLSLNQALIPWECLRHVDFLGRGKGPGT
jgi:hypothetical protein